MFILNMSYRTIRDIYKQKDMNTTLNELWNSTKKRKYANGFCFNCYRRIKIGFVSDKNYGEVEISFNGKRRFKPKYCK